MPYQNWEMQAKGLNYTQLTIEGAVTAITVKIQVRAHYLSFPLLLSKHSNIIVIMQYWSRFIDHSIMIKVQFQNTVNPNIDSSNANDCH